MDLKSITEYRKHIEITIWVLLIFLALFINLSQFPPIQESRFILNLLVLTAGVYTFSYYHYLAPRFEREITVLASTLVFTLFAILLVHFTGSLQSPIFALVFFPILVSAMLLGLPALFTVVTVELVWLVVEYVLYFETSFQPLQEPSILLLGSGVGILLITFGTYNNTREIIARESKQQELTREKERYRRMKERDDAVFRSIQDMVIALSREGKIIMVNKALTKLLELSEKEIVGQHYRDLFRIYEVGKLGQLMSEKDLLLTQEHSLYYQDTSQDSIVHDTKLISRVNDVERYVTHKSSPLNHGHGGELNQGAVVVIRDVTDEKELEQMKLDFVSMAAHELRTPITAIRGYVDALREEAADKLDQEQKTFLDRTEIATQQLATLMENLLSVSRIEKGNYNLNIDAVNWVKLAKKQVKEFQTRAKEQGLKLEWVESKSKIPRVQADSLRIIEVINNLLANAISYTHEGGIKVWVEHDAENQMVITHIKDTGQGIPKDALPHMFEKFFRVSGILEQGSKGTGLGLYISKKIVDLHHGKIWVKSELGVGSTFSFSLPTVNKKLDDHLQKITDGK